MMNVNIPAGLSRLVFTLHERTLHRPTFRYLEDLERTQWYMRESIEEIQERKLARLLAAANEHCPWHARRIQAAGLDDVAATDRVSLADLRRLPPMTRRDARENAEGIRWADVPGGAFKYNTGGSSGEPLIFWFGRSRQASDAAGRIRARRWWGVDLGDRECYLWGAPVELSKTDRVKTVRDRLLNQLVLNAFEMSASNMDEYAEALAEFQPHCIYGYASSIALLAAHITSNDIPLNLRSLRVVCTTGEPLYPHQRALIGEAFGVPVANEFGSRDIGFTAHESPQGQMLLISESIILEVLDADGNPVDVGETGEAVMTALHSEAQPFIRYRTGDVVRMSASHCAAGRGLHVIEQVEGRVTDFITRADGTVMHALAVIYAIRGTPGVAEFKLVQHTVRDLEVVVVPDSRWTAESRAQMTTGLQARLGADVHVDIRTVEAIPAEVSGKHRYVQSHVTLAPHLTRATASVGSEVAAP